jgi:hypothetical protein
MATERQIETNRRNGALSRGPTSELSKSQSRKNAVTHGLAGESADVEAARSPEFHDRRAKWAAEQNPVGEEGNWALDRVVASTFRIERCERAIDQIITETQQRASLVWDQDRAIEAATIAGRLARDPVLASRQLQTTLAGVYLLIEAWLGLAAALQADDDWSESEASIALNLLGVSPDLRSGRTLIDAPEGIDSIVFRRELTSEELERLEQLRDQALEPLEEMECRRAMAGHSALLSKSAKLVLRYEREAWKRYWDSMKELKAQAPTATAPPVVVAPALAQVIVEPPKVRERVVTPPSRSAEEKIRALQAEPAPIRLEVIDRLRSMAQVDDSEWLDALERRIECLPPLPGSYVPIAAGVRAGGH